MSEGRSARRDLAAVAAAGGACGGDKLSPNTRSRFHPPAHPSALEIKESAVINMSKNHSTGSIHFDIRRAVADA